MDALYRWFYRAAYIGMRTFWFVFRPQTRGVNVALWHAGELLLVRNSYRPGYTLPGGYIRFRETAREAAVREVREELQLSIGGSELLAWGWIDIRQEFKRDRVMIFEMHCAARPVVRIDNREVVAACFVRPDEVQRRRPAAPLAAYLAARQAER